MNKATNAIPQSSQVGDIELKHGCSTVAITTYLTAGDKAGTAAALVICTASATPAYANGVGAVSVYAVDGSTVIASGTKGSACKGA